MEAPTIVAIGEKYHEGASPKGGRQASQVTCADLTSCAEQNGTKQEWKPVHIVFERTWLVPDDTVQH